MNSLQDQVAIVTGGALGIGGAISRQLAASGARVLIADINVEAAGENAARIRRAGHVAEVQETDVAAGAAIRAMIERAVELWGRLDILVNNAYNIWGTDGDAVELEESAWSKGMNALTTAVFLGAKHAIPQMKKQGQGNIVNISSVHGLLMEPRTLTYEAGKAAIIAMTRQMAIDFGPLGVRVNAICPGHIATERIQPMWDENPSLLRLFEQQYPVRRVGTPDDIAHAVRFLCTDEASFITGHALVVDGGLSIQLQETFGVSQAKFMRDNPETKLPE